MRQLGALCQSGAKFRIAADTKDVLQDLKRGLQGMKRVLPSKNSTALDAWITAVVAEFKSKFLTKRSNDEVDVQRLFDADVVSRLQRKFVFVPVDKSPQTVGIVCKHYYQQQVEVALGSTQFAIATAEELDMAMQRFGRGDTRPVQQVPYVYISPKFHKNEPAWRTMSGTRRGGTTGRRPKNFATKTATKLSLLLSAIIDGFRAKARALEDKHGVSRCLMIGETTEVTAIVRGWELPECLKGKRKLVKTDFSAMFPSLDATTVIENVSRAVREVFTFKETTNHIAEAKVRPQLFEGKFRGAFWDLDPDGTNADDICEMVKLVVRNAFCRNRGRVYRQVGGVCMGGNASLQLATLTLAVIEWDSMEKKLSGDLREFAIKVHGYRYAMRYADDCAALEGVIRLLPTIEEYGLQYSTKEVPDQVVFVGAQLLSTDLGIRFSMCEKAAVIDLPLQRYPHVQSTMPSACYTGCTIGSMCYAAQFAWDDDGLIRNAVKLFDLMAAKGFTRQKMGVGIQRYCDATKRPASMMDRLQSALVGVFERRGAVTKPALDAGGDVYRFQNPCTECYACASLVFMQYLHKTRALRIAPDDAVAKKLREVLNTRCSIRALMEHQHADRRTGQHNIMEVPWVSECAITNFGALTCARYERTKGACGCSDRPTSYTEFEVHHFETNVPHSTKVCRPGVDVFAESIDKVRCEACNKSFNLKATIVQFPRVLVRVFPRRCWYEFFCNST